MFSFFSSKKKHSPDDSSEESSNPPIPGPSSDDFVHVNRENEPKPDGYSIYPSFNSGGLPYPSGQGVVPSNIPKIPKKEVNLLQGVPFQLAKELAVESNSDMMAVQLSEIMAFVTSRLQMQTMDYDFSVEKSVVMES